MTELRITLSDWVFNAVAAREVLTLSRDYFRLRKPLNGASTSWRASIAANRMNGSFRWNFSRKNAAPPPKTMSFAGL